MKSNSCSPGSIAISSVPMLSTAQADVLSADLALGQQLGQPQRLSSQLPVPVGRLEIQWPHFRCRRLVASSFQIAQT